MTDLSIRTTGEVLVAGAEIGRITFSKPYCEADLAGDYVPESYASGLVDTGELEEELAELEEHNKSLVAAITTAATALTLAQRIIVGVLPKFNWGAAELDAGAIALLNEAPIQIEHALNKAREVL